MKKSESKQTLGMIGLQALQKEIYQKEYAVLLLIKKIFQLGNIYKHCINDTIELFLSEDDTIELFLSEDDTIFA